MPCAQEITVTDVFPYLSDDDLKGLQNPSVLYKAYQVALAKDKANNTHKFLDAYSQDLFNQYNQIYSVSSKQMKLFAKERTISMEKSIIINQQNDCIKRYNENIKN